MKRLAAVFIAIMVFLCLSVPAFALVELEKPRPGQIINIIADGTGDWQGDFYLSALTELTREGDDLCLFFPASRVRLKGFFTENRRREFHFTGGESVGAADFDSEGRFTGVYSEVISLERPGASDKEAAWLDPSIVKPLRAEIRNSGVTVTLGNETLWGEERAQVTAFIDKLSGGHKPDWSKTELVTMEFESLGGGDLALREIKLTGLNGLCAESSYCECIWPVSATEIKATGEGRGSLHLTDGMGKSLCRMSFVCTAEDSGGYTFSCLCPQCGTEQGQALHFLNCGHFACTLAPEEYHEMAQCAIAGHCVSDSLDHSDCSNCRKPLCDGGVHGYGICVHVHAWVTYAITPASATAEGSVSNRCASCGAEYTQTLPRRA